MASGNSDITLIYLMGTIGTMLLAGGLFFFFVVYQKRLLQKQLEINEVKAEQQAEILKNTIRAQENERRRIAQDLHDEVGAMLSVVKLNVGRIERQTSEKAQALAGETKNYLDDVITQVRRISRALLPPSLEKLGIFPAVEELSKWVNKAESLNIECTKSGEHFRLESMRELALFRVVQELMNNAIKHSGASVVSIHFHFGERGLAILVADNGKGFELNDKLKTGLGLRNLESRSEMAGAKLKLKSVPGEGTRAIIFTPTDER